MTSLIARMDLDGLSWLSRRRAVRFALAAGLLFYFLYHSTRFEPARMEFLVPNVDTSILFAQSGSVYHNVAYPAPLKGSFFGLFPYPPSAVLLLYFLGAPGPWFFSAMWTLLMATGLLISFRASLAGENQEVQSAWLAVGLISLIFCDSPVAWDLRSGNSNLVYLGLVLAAYGLVRRYPRTAGALIGLSISLKLYSALLLLWLLIRGPKKALYAAAIVIAALWLVLPVVIFGAAGTVTLYKGWREQLRIAGGLWLSAGILMQRHGPPLINLQRAATVLSGSQPDAATPRLIVAGLWAIWMAALSWYGTRSLRYPDHACAPSRATLADWTVLMLAPLPFSPWLEPYHAVPMVPATILCLLVALDRGAGERAQKIAAAALVGLLAIRLAGVPFEVRGIALLAQFLIVVSAFALLRPSPALVAQPAGMRGSASPDKRLSSAGA